jgi:hypothetical protein
MRADTPKKLELTQKTASREFWPLVSYLAQLLFAELELKANLRLLRYSYYPGRCTKEARALKEKVSREFQP